MIRVNLNSRIGNFALPTLESYEHTIANGIGFESSTQQIKGNVEDYNTFANLLMASCLCAGPDAETVWSGYLIGVDGTFGQETRSVSVGDGFANSVKVRYTTVLDTPASTAFFTDTLSISRYGTRQEILSLNKTNSTVAGNLAQMELARRKNPITRPSSQVATGAPGDNSITLHWAGGYTFLDWLTTQIADTSTLQTTDQVKALLTAYAAINPYIGYDASRIVASGVSDTRFVAQDTTYRSKIETLLGQGNSSNQRLAWGVYQNGFIVKAWAGANPNAIDYTRQLGSSDIYTLSGIKIEPWNVRPDTNYKVVDLAVPGIGTGVDTGASFYVERVTCSVSGDSQGVTLEPQNSDSLDALLARIK